MAKHNREKMDDDLATIIGVLWGITSFAIRTFVEYKTNQGLDNKIGGLEAIKAGLKDEFLGTWRHSEEINNIDSQISDLRGKYK